MTTSFFRRIVTNEYLALALRLYVGYFFIYASVSKIPYPAQFADAIANYRLVPFWLLNPVAVILPWAELAAGLFLIIGFMPGTAAFLIGVLLVAFNVMVSINMAWGAPITCGCYDTVGEPIGFRKLFENFLMLAATVQIYYCNKPLVLRRAGRPAGAKAGGPSPAAS
jgi:putative oxidoreductase